MALAWTPVETPSYEAEGAIAEVVAAAAFVLLAGVVLWPPGAVYWTDVVPVLGETLTLAVVGCLAVGVGAWFARTSSVAVRHLLAGSLLAYVAGMAAIEIVLAPDSPVHLLWYGFLLAALVAGGLGWAAADRFVRTRSRGPSTAGSSGTKGR